MKKLKKKIVFISNLNLERQSGVIREWPLRGRQGDFLVCVGVLPLCG